MQTEFPLSQISEPLVTNGHFRPRPAACSIGHSELARESHLHSGPSMLIVCLQVPANCFKVTWDQESRQLLSASGRVGNKHLPGATGGTPLPRCARAPGLSGVDRRGRAADRPSCHREPSPARPAWPGAARQQSPGGRGARGSLAAPVEMDGLLVRSPSRRRLLTPFCLHLSSESGAGGSRAGWGAGGGSMKPGGDPAQQVVM